MRGHDAKSVARSLGLSVHTINERLREARRKMAVSSSREAARLLLEVEGDPSASTPQSFGDAEIRADERVPGADHGDAPIRRAEQAYPLSRMIIGAFVMTLALGLLALLAVSDAGPGGAPPPVVASETVNPELVEVARQWLGLVDQSRWDESYRATAPAFRKLNTVQVWAAASERVRVPLGAVQSRVFLSQENLPAPPAGYEVVKFRTSFANKADATETVTLDHEGGSWRVVGVTIG